MARLQATPITEIIKHKCEKLVGDSDQELEDYLTHLDDFFTSHGHDKLLHGYASQHHEDGEISFDEDIDRRLGSWVRTGMSNLWLNRLPKNCRHLSSIYQQLYQHSESRNHNCGLLLEREWALLSPNPGELPTQYSDRVLALYKRKAVSDKSLRDEHYVKKVLATIPREYETLAQNVYPTCDRITVTQLSEMLNAWQSMRRDREVCAPKEEGEGGVAMAAYHRGQPQRDGGGARRGAHHNGGGGRGGGRGGNGGYRGGHQAGNNGGGGGGNRGNGGDNNPARDAHVCENCGGTGHFKRECPSSKAGKNKAYMAQDPVQHAMLAYNQPTHAHTSQSRDAAHTHSVHVQVWLWLLLVHPAVPLLILSL